MSVCIECDRTMHPADAAQDLVCGACKYRGKKGHSVIGAVKIRADITDERRLLYPRKSRHLSESNDSCNNEEGAPNDA